MAMARAQIETRYLRHVEKPSGLLNVPVFEPLMIEVLD